LSSFSGIEEESLELELPQAAMLSADDRAITPASTLLIDFM
jgi:hypothetical protein